VAHWAPISWPSAWELKSSSWCRNSASSRGPRLLEEILRWGTTQLFDTSVAAGRDGGLQAQQDGPKQEARDKPEAMDVDQAGEDKSGGYDRSSVALGALSIPVAAPGSGLLVQGTAPWDIHSAM
jgi:hypothetical protein